MPSDLRGRDRLKRVLIDGFVIVASILLAFGIDAWWDRTKRAGEDAEWIAAVRLDLETTRGQIEEAIVASEAIVGAGSLALGLLSSPLPPPVDSLRKLTDRMMQPTIFTPTLPGFETGFSEGRFSVIESVEFRRGLADFEQWLQHFADAGRLAGDVMFIGPLYDVRARHGGFQLLGVEWRERFRMSDADYLEVMLASETFAALETMWVTQGHQLRSLRQMKNAVEAMMSSLEGGES